MNPKVVENSKPQGRQSISPTFLESPIIIQQDKTGVTALKLKNQASSKTKKGQVSLKSSYN